MFRRFLPPRGPTKTSSADKAARRSVELALESCLEDVQVHHKRLADCLEEYPSCADELRPLLTVALGIGAIPSVSPTVAFRRDLRRQLLEEVGDNSAQLPGSTDVYPFSQWKKALVALVLLTAISFALWGAVAALRTSVPGSPLYPIKRWTERIRMGLVRESAPAWVHANLARRRLDEVKALASCGAADLANQTAFDYEGEIKSAIDGLKADQEKRVSDASLAEAVYRRAGRARPVSETSSGFLDDRGETRSGGIDQSDRSA